MNIIGAGRIGSFFGSFPGAKIYTRQDSEYKNLNKGPIVIATRNDDLVDVISKVPRDRYKDLVFIQNGMYLDQIESFGVESPTLILLYVAVQNKGDTPVDGGGSLVSGPHSSVFLDFFSSNNLQLVHVDMDTIVSGMFEKLLWNSCFGLLCQCYGMSVGALVEKHRDDIDRLCLEFAGIVKDYAGVDLGEEVSNRLCEYSVTISDYIGSVKEFKWRNGWFIDKKRTAFHIALLEQAGVKV